MELQQYKSSCLITTTSTLSDIICLTSRWIMLCPFPPRFLNRAASFFDLWLYVLWPRQFQSRHNFSLPAKTVRHASLCLYFGVWIIVSPRFLERDANLSRILQFYARVVVELELRYVQRPLLARANLVVTAGSDFSIYIYTRRMHGIVGERERSN